MSAVEDRTKETEADKGSLQSQPTDDVLSRSMPETKSNNENGVVKKEEDAAKPEVDSDKDIDADVDSEAETWIESPEKKRMIAEGAPALNLSSYGDTRMKGDSILVRAPNSDVQSRKRKRSVDGQDGHGKRVSPSTSHRSSPLSSPVAVVHSADSDSDRHVRRKVHKNDGVKGKRNGERDRSPGSESRIGTHALRQRRPSDIAPHKRDKHNNEAAERRETRSATFPRQSDDEQRSPSPQPIPRRDHRRGVSTQSTGHEFGGKRRGRPPLLNTRRNRSAERATSVSSEDSNSPAPPRSAVHKLSGHDHDTMSPAKTGPRKWRDKNGRTFLARACNNNDLESARARLAERPEDLNWADNAGNTPLQIAALEGFVDIVKFLLEANCDVDTRNIDKETPLIDAVENGHVEVVKLLLDHGANPRWGNAKGDEPFELVPQDDENYEEIRALLAEAKERENRRHKLHEQVEAANRDGNSSRAASAASPRDSPPIGPRSPPTLASRRRTGRSESTRNDLLWQANTQENLTKLAGKGDVQGVASILNILQKAETESLIAAAKAGHEEVLQYLLGMGDPDPDPDPVRTLKSGFNTPILAAIGKGHIDVVKLLVNQSGFNPTRKYKEKAYYELSRERKGEDWQTEYEVLKKAYDNFTSSKGRKTGSPRKTRDAEKLKVRAIRRSSSPNSQKRLSSSPTMTHKSLSSKSSESSPRDKRKLPESERRKVSGGKHDTGDSSVAVASDMDQTTSATKKGHRVRRSQSDLSTPAKMESETTHRRRRLVTGKEHRRNKSTAPESDSNDEENEVIVVKQEDKPTPTLKRARSKSSLSPELKASEEVDNARQGAKKRRTVLESSPEEARNVPKKSQPAMPLEHPPQQPEVTEQTTITTKEKNVIEKAPVMNHELEISKPNVEANEEPKLILNRSDDPEILPDADTKAQQSHDEQPKKIAETTSELESVIETQSREKKEEEERLEKERADREAKAEADRLAKQEADRREAEARAEAERAEAVRRAAAEAKRIAAQKEAEEAERKRKAEEEELLKRKEEEERQEQLRRELEDQRRLEYLEKERLRREALPIVLNKCAAMVDNDDPAIRSPAWLTKFLPLFTVKTQQLEMESSVATDEEHWVPNFQVASLLATKDLALQSFPSIEKRDCTVHERQCLWRVARNMLSFEYEANGINTSVKQATQREVENRPKFLAMEELYWVKLSDFTNQVARHPHLSGLALRTQPISLASYSSLAQRSAPPQTNGISPGISKAINGVYPHSSRSETIIEQIIS